MLKKDDLAFPAQGVTPSFSETPASGDPSANPSPSGEAPGEEPSRGGHEGRGSEVSLAPDPLAEAEAQLEEMDVDQPLVGIVMGSKSDMEAMEKAANELEARGILHEMRVMSAHREPDVVAEYAKNARMRGLRVIIAGAGISAALPGAVAAHTELPVIGVPLSGRLTAAGGLDAILSIVQMPPGVPVACVGLDNPRNAAILAAQILGA
jgi:5-(carboxyamino)imidazole ribonucleotide mutase